LILLAVLPPLVWIGWRSYEAWKAEQERRAYLQRLQALQIPLIIDEVETSWHADLREFFREPPAVQPGNVDDHSKGS